MRTEQSHTPPPGPGYFDGQGESTPLWRVKVQRRKEQRRRRLKLLTLVAITAIYGGFVALARPTQGFYALLGTALSLPFGLAAGNLALLIAAVGWAVFMGEARDVFRQFSSRLQVMFAPVMRYYADTPQMFCIAVFVAVAFLLSISVRFGPKLVACGTDVSVAAYYDRWSDSPLAPEIVDVCSQHQELSQVAPEP